MSDLADRLMDVTATEEGLPAQFVPTATIRSFGSSIANGTWQQLRDRASGTVVIAAQAYKAVPKSLASDLAAAVRDASLPDQVKTDLTPPDNDAADRANRIAAAWVTQTLAPEPGEPVAVILLYPKTDGGLLGDGLEAPGPRSPIFVLLKGAFFADGSARVQQIIFGDPRETAGR